MVWAFRNSESMVSAPAAPDSTASSAVSIWSSRSADSSRNSSVRSASGSLTAEPFKRSEGPGHVDDTDEVTVGQRGSGQQV